jgi:DNA-binding transcriptional LysR family regulator
MQFGSTEAIKQAVAANVGIALVSHIAVGAEVSAGWLAVVHFEDMTLRRTFSLVQRRNGHPSALAEAFLQQLLFQAHKEEA